MKITIEADLQAARIDFELYHHSPMYTYEESLAMKSEKGFTGTETKALFMKGKKDGRYYILFTLPDKRNDFKYLKKLVGQKLSVVSPEELETETGQESGAVCPIGYPAEVGQLIHEDILKAEKLVFAPGRPDQTMVIKTQDLDKILDLYQNERFMVSDQVED